MIVFALPRDAKLRDGLWHATVEPGLVTSNRGQVFTFHADESPLELISDCDGRLFIGYMDREMARVEWELRRVLQGEAMLGTASPSLESMNPSIWQEFLKTSPELAEFASSNEFYVGENIMSIQGQAVPAMMLLGYSGLPGRAQERGDVSITLKMGPYQGFTLWARTGKADFQWVGESQAARDYVYEVCRCRDAITELESIRLGMRLQQALINSTHGLEKRRAGYDSSKGVDPMANERFDPSEPWQPSGQTPNWPCIRPGERSADAEPTQTTFKNDFKASWGAVRDALEKANGWGNVSGSTTSANVETGAETSSVTCEFKILANDICKICKDSEAEQASYMAHEQHHARTCRAKNKLRDEMNAWLEQASLGNATIPGLTQDEVYQAYQSDVAECFGYDAYMTNAQNAAIDELNAYRAGGDVLVEYIGKYCSR